jgi:hypothetical protein
VLIDYLSQASENQIETILTTHFVSVSNKSVFGFVFIKLFNRRRRARVTKMTY